MPFDKAGFQPIGGQGKRGKAPQLFSYKSTDNAATVDTANYFASVRENLDVGDLIYRVTMSGAAVASAGLHVVITKNATTIDVADATAINVSNAD